ncbi:hypothetical protein V5799_018692 [Amblyomma americanum]|uniref:eIF-4F 25 kDa subunit n=1 Tax=Amblyomma americanum TaxID=6943 RepID=A0AAQ4EYS9_AMBAM
MAAEGKRLEGDSNEREQSQLDRTNASLNRPLKHPLEHSWSLWYYKKDRSRSWQENLLEISSFDTVEDFWALYNHVEFPSKLPSGCDYSLFKAGIKPMWEDPRNKQGGRWLFNMSKNELGTSGVSKNEGPTDLDHCWLEVLLCLIGEGFGEFSDDVCGAVVQIRNKVDKISVWTADVRRLDGNVKIGNTLKERMNLHPRYIVPYHAHADTQSKQGSTARVRYEV